MASDNLRPVPLRKSFSSPEVTEQRSPSRSSSTFTPPRHGSGTPSRSSSRSSAGRRQIAERIVVIFEELPLNMLLLRNEESKLMEVMETYGKARSKGVRVGDILIEMGGKRLEIGLHHDKIVSYISTASFPLQFTFWRSIPGKRYIDTVVAWRGQQIISIVDKNNNDQIANIPKNATLVLTEPRNFLADTGFVFASEVLSSTAANSFLEGDIIVGFMYVPLSSTLTGQGLVQILETQTGNNIHINIWRSSSHGRPTPLTPRVVRKKEVSSIKSPNTANMEMLADEAPLSLSSMMDMMGNVGSYLPSSFTPPILSPTSPATRSRPEPDSPKISNHGRRVHYSNENLASALYASSSDSTPWIFEQSVWCGGVECEWHVDEVEDEDTRRRSTDDFSNLPPPPSPSSPERMNSGNDDDGDDTPRRRTSSFFSSPQPVRRKARDEESSDAIIDVTVLVTEASLFLLHSTPRSTTPFYLALALTPEMILDVGLPYYTLNVNGDEVAVRSSEVQLRLKQTALTTLDAESTVQWFPTCLTPTDQTTRDARTPPWKQPAFINKATQHSLIFCTESNMHRAELLETITLWYEDATGESLPVDQVPYLGSPPAAKPQNSYLEAPKEAEQSPVKLEQSVDTDNKIEEEDGTVESSEKEDIQEDPEEESQAAEEVIGPTTPKTPTKAKRGTVFGLFKKKNSKN